MKLWFIRYDQESLSYEFSKTPFREILDTIIQSTNSCDSLSNVKIEKIMQNFLLLMN